MIGDVEELHVERGGDGPALLLLHGLGGSAASWSGVIDRWPGSWTAVDLPGHGLSAPLPRYSFGALATTVARVVDGPVAILGHSLGGVVALALASGWFGVPVTAVCALGVKVSWSAEDLAKAADLSRRPPKVFASEDEALDRARKVAGLPPDGPADRLITPTEGGWRLSLDPAAFAVGRPDLPGLLAAARCPVTLASGSADPMSPPDHLAALVPDPLILPGLGHSAHVEDPAALDPLLDRLR